MQALKKTNKTTPWSEWSGVLKKSLTEPTLLEMSDKPCGLNGSVLAHIVGLSEHEHQFQLHKAPMNDGLS